MAATRRLLLLLGLVTRCLSQVQTVDGRIKLQVGGSAGCPFVAIYIRDSLASVHDKYGQFLDVEFVPWGNTRRVDGEVVCQFGAADCWANRLHRCALDLLSGNQTAQVGYMKCEFTDPRPGYTGSYRCADEAGLRLIEVDHCMASSRGAELEAAAEAAAAEASAFFRFIPYTVFNGHLDLPNTQQASARLESLICFALADDPTTGVTACKI